MLYIVEFDSWVPNFQTKWVTGQFPCIFENVFEYQLGYARCLLIISQLHLFLNYWLLLKKTYVWIVVTVKKKAFSTLVQGCMFAWQFNFAKALNFRSCNWFIKGVDDAESGESRKNQDCWDVCKIIFSMHNVLEEVYFC